MADLKRWFKVWTSVLDDLHFQEMALEDIGRWVELGALIASVGSRGRLTSPREARRLREVLRVESLDALKACLERLPNVRVEEGQNRHDEFTVTMEKWTKYQEDSTQAERARASRAKRRGEEIRRDETREEETNKKRSRAVLADDAFIAELKANHSYRGIDVDRELGKMDAWLLTPKAKGRTKTRGFIVNWLNKIDRPIETAQGPRSGYVPKDWVDNMNWTLGLEPDEQRELQTFGRQHNLPPAEALTRWRASRKKAS